MSGKRRSNGQLARDRRRIANLYLQGWLQVDIAQEVGVSQSTVSLDIKALQKQWLASALVDIDAAKSKELARIDRLEREYWDAWLRSQEDAETTKTKWEEKGGSSTEEISKGQVGDPRFLQGVEWCIERRCKILGIDAPQKQEISGPGGTAIEVVEIVRDYGEQNIGSIRDQE